jgi:hypothetical protein
LKPPSSGRTREIWNTWFLMLGNSASSPTGTFSWLICYSHSPIRIMCLLIPDLSMDSWFLPINLFMC